MAARTERRVDEHSARAVGVVPGQRGLEQFDAAVEQDGDVSVVRGRSHG